MSKEDTFHYRSTARLPVPSFRYKEIKETILGKDYHLSLAFVGEVTMRKINRIYRKKDYATNVLAFPYERKDGELLLCPFVIKKQTKNFKRTYQEHFLALYIHGLLHLKGFLHGESMERQETALIKKFSAGKKSTT